MGQSPEQIADRLGVTLYAMPVDAPAPDVRLYRHARWNDDRGRGAEGNGDGGCWGSCGVRGKANGGRPVAMLHRCSGAGDDYGTRKKSTPK